jgi:RNA polymerase subunit RPABC4/transcription elongation factor Spt4
MFGSGSMWGDIITLVGLIAVAYVAAVWISLVVWTHRDVKHRSADPNERLAAVVLVALFSAPGWLVYLLLRPADTLEDTRIETLQEQLFARELAMVPSCTRCRRRVSDDYLVCPYCREELRAPCVSCGRAVAMAWDACAYCGTATRRAIPAAPRPAATTDGVRGPSKPLQPLMPTGAR